MKLAIEIVVAVIMAGSAGVLIGGVLRMMWGEDSHEYEEMFTERSKRG